MGRLDRYLLKEIALPFAVSLGLLAVLVTFGELLEISDSLSGLRLSPGDFAQAVLYSLPPLLGLLLPICTLFAVLLGVGRLASDREVVAMSALGWAPARLLRVPAALGVLLGLVCGAAMWWGEAWGIRGVQRVLARGAQAALSQNIQPGQFYEWSEGLSFLARSRVGHELRDVLLVDRRSEERPVVIAAQRGSLRPGEHTRDLVLELTAGSMLLAERGVESYRRVTFQRSRYRIDVGNLVEGRLANVTKAQSMTPSQLLAEAQTEERLRRKALLIITYHRKLALPLATLIFALLAVPLAMQSRGSARAWGFLAGALLVAAYYYVGRGLELSARGGGVSPAVAAWTPNALGALGFVVLWWRRRRVRR